MRGDSEGFRPLAIIINMTGNTPKTIINSSNSKSPGRGTSPRKPHRRHASSMRLIRLILTCVVICIVVALVLGLPLMLSGAKNEAIIKVPKEADVQAVEDSIAKYLGVDYARKVGQSLKLLSYDVNSRHGAYLITKGLSPLKAAHRIAKGAPTGINLTINGQRTKDDLARLIASRLEVSEEQMLAAFDDSKLLAKYDASPEKVMTYFLNNTYQFYWDASPEDIISKMRSEYRKFWTDARRKKAEALRLSPKEISIVASIVDEETNLKAEKGMVGRLYINRLNQGMKLQADPTVKYALGDFSIRRISSAQTRVQSPYNTYVVAGLPIGPIRTPDPATIDAILDSEPSDYIYMCADPSLNGSHRFAADYATHLANARAYQSHLDTLNIRK